MYAAPSTTPLARSFIALAIALLALALGGCTMGRYVAQAACGQIDLLVRRRSVESVVADERTPTRLRGLLTRVPSIKQFGERNGLTATRNYSTFVALPRRAAVWVVTAAEPLGFRTKTYWFPIAGDVPYLGWFDQRDARDFAAGLSSDGWDVDVRGASAYSTLGWFSDPILSTMISEEDEALGGLAEVVLHESLHATLYVEGQTAFNESVANFVGEKLALAYLDAEIGPSSAERTAYVEGLDEARKSEKAMKAARARLEQVYSSKAAVSEKLAEKRRIFTELRRGIEAARPITNATLAAYDAYSSGVTELEALFDACKRSWPRFVGTLKTVKRGSFQEPQQDDVGSVILGLARAGCPAKVEESARPIRTR